MLLLTVASVAGAAPGPKLQTFGTGDVTVGTDGASATIVNDAGESGGVFLNSKSQGSKPLSKVVFAFTSRGDVAGGAPRFSIGIDTDGNPQTSNGFAFLDAAGCGATVGDNPTSVATLVSTQNPACAVNFSGTDYANWDAFAAANPTYKTNSGGTPFIIADQAGTYVVTNIVLR
ncbi:MAG TPA: hypothetical protein VFU99_07045 [Gaiellaceae bacterium]|nr:hypothetical protein [Gaiellaceae bacterium]